MTPPPTPVAFPITPQTVTVNGYRVTESYAAWRGLDWSNVRLWESKIEPGAQTLVVSWKHPDDPPPADCFYRVRPRRKGWRFVLVGDVWMIAHSTPAARPRRSGSTISNARGDTNA